MPIEIKKYTCRFKCGKKAISSKRKMQKHEDSFCFKNPENKTCATCINSVYEKDSDDYNVWHIRGCLMPSMNLFLEDIHDELEIKNSAKAHISPLWHCPNHNQNGEQISTELYINEVREKIMNHYKEIEIIKDDLPF